MGIQPNYVDIEYVQGQYEALRAVVLGIANLLLEQEEFREESLRRLEALRSALLPTDVAEVRLRAIDDCERWVKTLTG